MDPTFNRRRFDDVTMETLDLRVTALEDGMESIRFDMANAVREIQANTALTEDIHADTKDIVEVLADFKVILKWGRRIGKPFVIVCAFGVAVGIYLKTGKWLWPS